MDKVKIEDLVKAGLDTMPVSREEAEVLISEAVEEGDLSKEEGETCLDRLKEIAKRSYEECKSIEAEINSSMHWIRG